MNGKNMYKYGMLMEQPGDSRWATPDEIKQCTNRVNLRDSDYPVAGLPVLIEDDDVYMDGVDTHALIFGTTGSKKTRLFCMPMTNLMIKAGESFIVTDPKGEIYAKTSGLAKEKGYTIRVVNFRDLGKGDCWNPLDLPCRLYKSGDPDKIGRAYSMVNDIVSFLVPEGYSGDDGPFWENTSRSYLNASIQFLFEAATMKELNFASLIRLCTYRNAILLKYFARLMRPELPIAINFNSVCSSAQRTLQSIVVSAFSNLAAFISDDRLVRKLSKDTLHIQDIGKQKTAFYLIVPDEKNTYNFLAGMLVKQLYESMIEVAQTSPDGRLPVRVNFILDEFCNFPTIPQMANMISAGRSRNIRFYLVAQSLHQLKEKYKEDADTIIGNCEDLVFLASREWDLLALVTSLCGNVKKDTPLISTSDLQRLNKERGEALFLIKRNPPFISEMRDIDSYPMFAGFRPEPFSEIEVPEIALFDLEPLARRVSQGEAAPFEKKAVSSGNSGRGGFETGVSLQAQLDRLSASGYEIGSVEAADARNKLKYVLEHGYDPER